MFTHVARGSRCCSRRWPSVPHRPSPTTMTPPRTTACAQPVTDQNFYFVMADRFENGDAANDNGGLPPGKGAGQSGFDPTGKGWYHGGDLKGLTASSTTSRASGRPRSGSRRASRTRPSSREDNSAGYHGYWITDFTQIDPHLGTNDGPARARRRRAPRGIKVYFDIITNHTADVIKYRRAGGCRTRPRTSTPYKTAAGTPFDDRDYAGTNSSRARADRPAVVPAPAAELPLPPVRAGRRAQRQGPAWLNDVTLYHNRGDTTFTGENSLYGDFFGLDDLFTENPRVVDGMIDIYKGWIRDFRIDGFRMDTMKHVNDEFWQKFAPAIAALREVAGDPRLLHVRRGRRGLQPADPLALHDP